MRETDGPDFNVEGKLAKYRDVIEWKGDDHRVLTSHVRDDDGKWNGLMAAHCRQKK